MRLLRLLFVLPLLLAHCADERASSSTSSSGGGGSGAGNAVGGHAGTGGGAHGGGPPATSCTDIACAFPGAEGFGTDTPGGRGGAVLVVTTLAADGPGSLQQALLTPGPRIIVFAVSGVIDLAGATIELAEEHSFLTVAGQSSPGGVTLRNGTISAYHSGFHDAVFRFLRFRGTTNYDNVSLATTHHIVFDHVDFSGATDETFDVTSASDVTLSWSTITNSAAGNGSQNYGALIAYKPTTRISIHHNFMANHLGRCAAQMHWAGDEPEPPDGAWLDFRNNVLHNCGFQQLLRADSPPTTGLRANLVGNYATSGPNTPAESMMFGLGGDVFVDDNVYQGQSLVLTPFFDGTLHDQPFDFAPVTTTSAAEARDQVLAWVGAWPRDAMNQRTVAEAEAGTGQLGKIDDPLITSGPSPEPDGDGDGLPDAWELQSGLDPADPSDSNVSDGAYSPLEIYLAERAAAAFGT
ncbi:MAG: hypothetical protein KC731_07030 [Myxococcales bacterium]|nr:hypothetical protein [Myxococcales bacterium]